MMIVFEETRIVNGAMYVATTIVIFLHTGMIVFQSLVLVNLLKEQYYEQEVIA